MESRCVWGGVGFERKGGFWDWAYEMEAGFAVLKIELRGCQVCCRKGGLRFEGGLRFPLRARAPASWSPAGRGCLGVEQNHNVLPPYNPRPPPAKRSAPATPASAPEAIKHPSHPPSKHPQQPLKSTPNTPKATLPPKNQPRLHLGFRLGGVALGPFPPKAPPTLPQKGTSKPPKATPSKQNQPRLYPRVRLGGVALHSEARVTPHHLLQAGLALGGGWFVFEV